MVHPNSYGDSRSLMGCIFCGGLTGTRDHCPSKVLLDQPYPNNLPVVSACLDCNQGFSSDEEYLACLLSCVLVGTTDLKKIKRIKVRKILSRKPALQNKIELSLVANHERSFFIPEIERVKKVIVKLARGHAAFELNESVIQAPLEVSVFPILSISSEQRCEFELISNPEIWPEVGCRAMQRMITGKGICDAGWVVIQRNNYRYGVAWGEGVEVRIVISEYLGAVVRWI